MSQAVDENGYFSLGRVVSALTAISLIIGIGTQCSWRDVGATPVTAHDSLARDVESFEAQVDRKLDRNFCSEATETTLEFQRCMEKRGH